MSQITIGLSGHIDHGKTSIVKSLTGKNTDNLKEEIHRGMTINIGFAFLNEQITGMKPFRVFEKGISYVPQVENIFSNLTISENLDIGFYTSKINDTKNELDKIYSFFPQLKNKKSIKSGNLSGGERQMLAIARALIGDPKLLLLDEPTASLAPNLVNEIMQKLIQIKDSGTSMLLVEQNAKKSLDISERCYVLVMGKNFFEGKASEIIQNKESGRMFLGKK